METNKIRNWKRIALGALQIAVINSLGLYFLCACSHNVFILFAAPPVIGFICGVAIVGKSIKEAALKWIISIPLWWAVLLSVVKSGINRRLTLQLTGYDDLTTGDGLGYMLAIIFAMFWSLVLMGVGVWLSGYGKKSKKQQKIFCVIQTVSINIVCVALIIGLITLNAALPTYIAVINYT